MKQRGSGRRRAWRRAGSSGLATTPARGAPSIRRMIITEWAGPRGPRAAETLESHPMASLAAPAPSPAPPPADARSLRDLTSAQKKSGIAAWLGWLFDGLDMHLYTLVAAPFVMELLAASSPADAAVREKSSWIQAAFLTGWALGGGLVVRLGDRLGPSSALTLTIPTHPPLTALSYLTHHQL